MSLISDDLKNDPRFSQAKQLFLDVLQEKKKKLTGVKPADPKLKKNYEEILADFARIRGGPLWHTYLGSGIGNGALVELCDGSVKYDMISGIGVHFFGHSHPELISACLDAALEDIVMQGHLQQNRISYELSKMLVEASGMDHCFLTSSGVMANENALKILFQYKHPANRILVFEKCFMGRTLFASQLTDKPAFRQGLPRNVNVDYVPFYDYQNPEKSLKRALGRLKEHLTRYPNEHIAMCFEMVQGEAGFYSGTHEFFKELMVVLKNHQIPIMVDEVQTFARTPKLFAFQYFGLEEFIDILTIGKLSQVCATLYKDFLQPKPGLLSQTFTASTSALYASKAILQLLQKENYFGEEGKIVKVHHQFVKAFSEMESIDEPYGLGTMIAFTPFKGDSETAQKLARSLFENGVVCFTAGTDPTRIRFLVPAGAINSEAIQNVCQILEKTIKDY